MVCTRKKYYGDALPPKPRKPSSGRKGTVVVKGPDAVAEAGHSDDTRGMPEKSHNDEQLPYSEFTLFHKLPCELRLMIWAASMTPRLVPVGPRSEGRRILYSHSKVFPALFSVNKESRYCAIRHYTLRFTIAVTVDRSGGRHRWDCPNFVGDTHRAHVLMSPDDTLGFFGWRNLNLGNRHKFRVESADGTSPWESHPANRGAQPEVRKVAYLGPDIASYHKIVHDLNSTISWDLDSILHNTEPGGIRNLYPLCGPWYTAAEAADSKHHILIRSCNYNGSLEECGERLMLRASNWGLTLWKGAPDIVVFELGKDPEHHPGPAHYVRSVEEDDFNALWLNYEFSLNFPDHRGF